MRVFSIWEVCGTFGVVGWHGGINVCQFGQLSWRIRSTRFASFVRRWVSNAAVLLIGISAYIVGGGV